jgi:hypothetical protein
VTPAEVAKVLRDYNAWRRGDEDMDMPDPKAIGEVIDEAVGMFESSGNAGLIAGYIVMIRPKWQAKNHEAGWYPLAYADSDDDTYPDILMRDRGATLFSSRKAANGALRTTIEKATAHGWNWVETNDFATLEVRNQPA